MKQERLKVLSMLEEGKISADEAAMLLDKINQGSDGSHFISEETSEQIEEKLKSFAKGAESLAKELAHKAEHVYKDMEPKLKKASQVVIEKTAAIVDDIAHALHESIENAKNKAEKECCDEDNCACEIKPNDDDTPKPN